MSTKSKKSTETAKSMDSTVSQRDDLKCWIREQDPYRSRTVGVTVRKKDGSTRSYSKYDKTPPGTTKVDRYPLTTSRRESEQWTDGMGSHVCRITETLTIEADRSDHREVSTSKEHTKSEEPRGTIKGPNRHSARSGTKSRKTGWW
jgi:hypothetical protein